MQDYIFLSVGRVGSSTELIKQEVLRVDAGEKQMILIDLLSTVQETMNNGNPDRKVRLRSLHRPASDRSKRSQLCGMPLQHTRPVSRSVAPSA